MGGKDSRTPVSLATGGSDGRSHGHKSTLKKARGNAGARRCEPHCLVNNVKNDGGTQTLHVEPKSPKRITAWGKGKSRNRNQLGKPQQNALRRNGRITQKRKLLGQHRELWCGRLWVKPQFGSMKGSEQIPGVVRGGGLNQDAKGLNGGGRK